MFYQTHNKGLRKLFLTVSWDVPSRQINDFLSIWPHNVATYLFFTQNENNFLKDTTDEEDGRARDIVEWLMEDCDYVEKFGNFTLLKWSDFRRQESVNGYILVS